ncbi:MAG: hypothetical protein ABW250_04425 [Pyrinomonadaceae bacterium]
MTPAATQTTAHADAPSVRESRADGADGGEVFVLPGGYVDTHGAAHEEVELVPLTGFDEEMLARARPNEVAARLVTRLLARCVRRVGTLEGADAARAVADLCAGDRDFLVIKLREMTGGPKLAVVLRCPGEGCGRPMDLELMLDEIEVERRPLRRRFFELELSDEAAYRDAGGAVHKRAEFRLPTGADQEALAALTRADLGLARRHLFARCLRRVGDFGEVDEGLVALLPERALEEIEARMAELAPDLTLELEAACPECGSRFETRLNLVELLLGELRGGTRELEREVHFLAWHYHWSERDVLSMTRAKRRRYVALLNEELERLA